MRRIITILPILVLVLAPLQASGDDIESLIDTEKVEQEPAPDAGGDDVPPAFLLGDSSSVALYSSSVYGGDPSPICDSFPFDELIDMNDSDPLAEDVVLNMRLPRVKQTVEEACLIRPGDDVLAVGRGRQTWVLIRDFVIRKAPGVCPSDSPYSLTARVDTVLADEPLFYSTDADLKEGENDFRLIAMSTASRAPLTGVVADIQEYDVRMATVSASNVDAFFHLKRRQLTPEDDGFPNEMVLWQSGDQIQILSQEAVDSVGGSGRLNVEAVFDYNRDGRLDVWIRGDQKKCPFHLLYEGGEEGFIPVDLPNKPCSC